MPPRKVDPARVRHLHARGLTGVQMAAELGCTPPRVHQVCRQLGLPLPGPRTGVSKIRPGRLPDSRLTVLRRSRAAGKISWVCRCDCGRTCIVRAALLRAGRTRSCGCLRAEVAAAHCRPLGVAVQAKRRGRQPKKP